jgi:hypothetical protein
MMHEQARPCGRAAEVVESVILGEPIAGPDAIAVWWLRRHRRAPALTGDGERGGVG